MKGLFVVGAIWVMIFAVALVLVHDQLLVREPDGTSNGIDGPDSNGLPRSGFVELHVDGHVISDFWTRGTSDLPVLCVELSYCVENMGNATADVVNVEVTLDTVYQLSTTVHDLSPGHPFTDFFTVHVDYDQTRTIVVQASYGSVLGSWSHSVDAELPRTFAMGTSKLFVTPNEQSVQSTYRNIVSGFVPVHWIAIRDWVGRNIEYVEDTESHEMTEFWQLSAETLTTQMGDCEDSAILLCSLLRADGWSSDEVYVVLGRNEEGHYHAWVKVKIPFVGWYNIDPQLDGWNTLLGDYVALRGFTAVYNFNDVELKEV